MTLAQSILVHLVGFVGACTFASYVNADGVLSAFADVGQEEGIYRVHWSANGGDLGTGPVAYEGTSRAICMTAFGDGRLTAFSDAGAIGQYRVHWSKGSQRLGEGQIVYEGTSPVTAMTTYNGGVLTAFSNAGPNGYRVHFSPNGQDLGGGSIAYDGKSPVSAMTVYNGGVLTAFSNAGPNGYRVHFSPNGQNLGEGSIAYDGTSPVSAMTEYNGGVLTAFSNAGPSGYRVHFSPNGQNLGEGSIAYDGTSPVSAMTEYNGGVLTAFSNAGPSGYRVHFSPNGQNLGEGSIAYDGTSPVTAMLTYGGEITGLQMAKTGSGPYPMQNLHPMLQSYHQAISSPTQNDGDLTNLVELEIFFRQLDILGDTDGFLAGDADYYYHFDVNGKQEVVRIRDHNISSPKGSAIPLNHSKKLDVGKGGNFRLSGVVMDADDGLFTGSDDGCGSFDFLVSEAEIPQSGTWHELSRTFQGEGDSKQTIHISIRRLN